MFKNRIVYLSVVFFFLTFLVFPTWAGEKAEVLKQAEEFFGTRVDPEHHRFEINQDFVVSLEFENDKLIKIDISPKYYFREEHPEWLEPDERPWLSVSRLFRSAH